MTFQDKSWSGLTQKLKEQMRKGRGKKGNEKLKSARQQRLLECKPQGTFSTTALLQKRALGHLFTEKLYRITTYYYYLTKGLNKGKTEGRKWRKLSFPLVFISILLRESLAFCILNGGKVYPPLLFCLKGVQNIKREARIP